MNTPEFQLEAGSGLLTARQLAKKLGISDQTVYNYADGTPAGMPRHIDPATGGFVYDADECAAWITTHKPQDGKGGRRRGSGRKTKEQEKAESHIAQGHIANGQMPQGHSPEGRTPQGQDIFADARQAAIQLPNVKSLDDIFTLLSKGELNAVQLDQLRLIQDAALKHMKIDAERGKLADVEAVKSMVMSALLPINQRLSEAVGQATLRIGSELGLGVEQLHTVRSILLEVTDALRAQIEADPFGASVQRPG